MNEWSTTKAVALTLAVLHHGFSNLADRSVPAGYSTVIATADKFKEWLDK
jgi:hypothetical protein